MKQHLEEDAELRRYLLGELTLEEQVSVEARLFLDDEYQSQLKAVEDELVDAYAYDELAADEREKVRSRLLPKPGRREDLRIARALKRRLSQEEDLVTPPVPPASDPRAVAEPASGSGPTPSPVKKGPVSLLASLFPRRPVVGYALAAAALVGLSLLVWFSLESLRRQGQSPPMQAEGPTPQPSKPAESEPPGGEVQANQRGPASEEEVARRDGPTRDGAGAGEKGGRARQLNGRPREVRTPARPRPTEVATFLVLPGGVVRGPGGAGKVILSPEVGTVVLRVPVVMAGDYRLYHAKLHAGGRVVYSRADLKPEVDAQLGRLVVLEVPASLLRQRRHEIQLGGVAEGGRTRGVISYTFEVERR